MAGLNKHYKPINPAATLNDDDTQDDNDQSSPATPPQTQSFSQYNDDPLRQQLYQNLLQRGQQGIQTEQQNKVTSEDVANNQRNEGLRDIVSSLFQGSQAAGNVRGQYQPSFVPGQMNQMNQQDQQALAQKNMLSQQGQQQQMSAMQGIGQLKQDEMARMQFEFQRQQNDPSSDRSQAARESYKSILGGKIDIPDSMSEAQLAQMFPQLSKMVQNQVTNATKQNISANALQEKKIEAGQRSSDRSQLQSQRLDERDEKGFQQLSDHLDPTKGRAGIFGKYQDTVDSSDKIQQLVTDSGGNLKNLDQRQMNELAIAVNKMLGGSQSEHGIKDLVPQTLVGDLNAIKERLTNAPQGMGQQEFVKRMYETMDRERSLAQSKLKGVQIQRARGYEDLRQRHPDRFQQILDNYGISNDEYSNKSSMGGKQLTPTGTTTVIPQAD
jgi:hypothetical protein